MKTERRHELQTNILADSLAHWIEAAKPYSRAALALVVALVVAIISWGYLSAQNSRRNAEGWQHYFDSFNGGDPSEALTETSEQFAGTQVGDWSRLVLADIELDRGTNQLFVEKTDGRNRLKQASELYRSVLSDSREPMLLARATFGLARAHEALGTLDDARKEYRSIPQQWPDSPFAAPAAKRAKDLEQASTKGFYDWFVKYEPVRPVTGLPGARPDFLKDPLENTGSKLPSAIDDSTPLPKFGEPAEGAPADENQPTAPAGDQPAEPAAEKPADETPSAEKPALDQPADEKPAEPK